MYKYSTPLGFTSQFSFCGLPVRLDTYSGCSFSCTYCFARLRGGNTGSNKLKVADPNSVIKFFKTAFEKPDMSTGLLSNAIRKRMPVHLGGMSDPFQPIERTEKTTLKLLTYLCKIQYPIVVSTRSNLVADQEYLAPLRDNPNVVLQFSFSSSLDSVSKVTEPFALSPSEIFPAINKLSSKGIKTTVRWQPLIPSVSESPERFVKNISDLGVRHLGLEHLKLPVERKSLLWQRLTTQLGFDIFKFYQEVGAVADGREYILPPEFKLPNIVRSKQLSNQYGLTFGAADNEFQFLSDNYCCCSGVDQFPGFDNWNKYQISYAVKSSNYEDITFDLIRNEWYPLGAIDKHLNSQSRIKNKTEFNQIPDYIKERWENLKSAFNPTKMFGVIYSGRRDLWGYKIYEWDMDKVKLMTESSK